ncbi:MAG: GAF domain-containing protein [Gammaproteobacteria bacterium]|nr:GAF domain-containing protein [Gammaproteobacteria bacterium]
MSEPLASALPTSPAGDGGVSRLSERALQGLLRERGWRAATAALCTELTLALGCRRVALGCRRVALGCRRVALGWRVDGRVRVVGLSHGAQLAEHPVLGGVAEAMHEAMGQGLTLCVPRVADGSVRITLAQRALIKREGVAAVLTVPLAQDGEVLGALLCERDDGRFTPIDNIAMEDVARTVAPLLRLLHEGELSWRQRWQRSWRAWVAADDPRTRRLRQAGLGIAGLMLVALMAVPLPHRVQANARVEGAEQRGLTAPLDAYLRQLHVRPGDFIKRVRCWRSCPTRTCGSRRAAERPRSRSTTTLSSMPSPRVSAARRRRPRHVPPKRGRSWRWSSSSWRARASPHLLMAS